MYRYYIDSVLRGYVLDIRIKCTFNAVLFVWRRCEISAVGHKQSVLCACRMHRLDRME